jgi:hypothetical protein
MNVTYLVFVSVLIAFVVDGWERSGDLVDLDVSD